MNCGFCTFLLPGKNDCGTVPYGFVSKSQSSVSESNGLKRILSELLNKILDKKDSMPGEFRWLARITDKSSGNQASWL